MISLLLSVGSWVHLPMKKPSATAMILTKEEKKMVDFNLLNMQTFAANNGQYPSGTRYK